MLRTEEVSHLQPQLTVTRPLLKGIPHLPVATQPFTVVDSVFRNNMHTSGVDHIIQGRCPIYQIGDRPEIRDGHNVRRGYSDQADPYVKTTITYLNLLASGLFFGEAEREPDQFAQRIIASFTNQTEAASYRRALVGATYNLMDEFQERYPNLVPVLFALMKGLGGAGLGTALEKSLDDLHHAVQGLLTPNSIKDKQKVSRINFVGIHPLSEEETGTGFPGSYEKMCSGEALASTIAEQSHEAAVRIVAAGRGANYNVLTDNNIPMSRIADFYCHVERLYEQTYKKASSQ